jgi:hypothetical protein
MAISHFIFHYHAISLMHTVMHLDNRYWSSKLVAVSAFRKRGADLHLQRLFGFHVLEVAQIIDL